MAVLSTAGCNSGSCHGLPSGRGGFRLSLWGHDPAADYLQLTRDEREMPRGKHRNSRQVRTR